MHPKISVITVVYNDENHIDSTIESVINQSYHNVEYLIIDGASSDATLNKIQNYRSKIDIVVSEPDKGIYDAMNKGIMLATGEWLIFLNSGDSFSDNGILEKVSTVLETESDSDIVYGNVSVFSEDYNLIYALQAKSVSNLRRNMPMNHQACFIKNALHKQDHYNLKYRIAADYYFILKCYLNGGKITQTPHAISIISTGGLSDANRLKTFRETLNIKNELVPSILNYWHFFKDVSYMLLVSGIRKSGSSSFFLKLYKLKYKLK